MGVVFLQGAQGGKHDRCERVTDDLLDEEPSGWRGKEVEEEDEEVEEPDRRRRRRGN